MPSLRPQTKGSPEFRGRIQSDSSPYASDESNASKGTMTRNESHNSRDDRTTIGAGVPPGLYVSPENLMGRRMILRAVQPQRLPRPALPIANRHRKRGDLAGDFRNISGKPRSLRRCRASRSVNIYVRKRSRPCRRRRWQESHPVDGKFRAVRLPGLREPGTSRRAQCRSTMFQGYVRNG
jgi:hypothetical protein